MFKKLLKINKNKGASLVEMILYIFILSIILGIIAQMFVSLGGIYRNIRMNRELESSGYSIVNNLMREIKGASSVVINESIFATSTGKITLSGFDENDIAYSIIFNKIENTVKISKNNEAFVSITPNSVSVDSLIFNYLSGTNSDAVKFELSISAVSKNITKSKKFYGFGVLRGSY